MSPAWSRWSRVICITAALTVAAGCTTSLPPASFKRPAMDLSLVKRLAVLPLDNLTREQMAHEKVRRVVVSELLATGAFDVVDPGEVSRAVMDLGTPPGAPIRIEEMKKLGKALDVQAVVMGSVEEYGEVRSGNVVAPLVALTLRMVETQAGNIVWSVSHTEGGISLGARLLGSTRETIGDTTIKAVRKALVTLFQ